MALFRPVLVLPTLAVAAVAAAVLVVGRPRPVVGTRLRGGPTEGARTLSFRLEVVERLGDTERPLAGRRVSLDAHFSEGDAETWSGTLDAEGAAAVTLGRRATPVHGPVHVRVSADGLREAVADRAIGVTVADWSANARRRGGWVRGSSNPSTVVAAIRAAPARGVFAVPFREALWVELVGVDLPDTPIAIRASSEGAQIEGALAVSRAHPRARLAVTPIEHSPSVSFVATLPGGTDARLELAPAVVPGAMRASLSGGALVVESPIARDRAYLALVNEVERVGGGTVILSPDDRGGARGSLALPPVPDGQIWAVVSSEPDLHSGALVGWPLRETESPPTTFDVPDVLALDTVGEAWARELHRVRRVRARAAWASVLTLLVTGFVMVRGARRSRASLEAHLTEAGADDETRDRLAGSGAEGRWLIGAALFCIAIAAIMAAVFASWK